VRMCRTMSLLRTVRRQGSFKYYIMESVIFLCFLTFMSNNYIVHSDDWASHRPFSRESNQRWPV